MAWVRLDDQMPDHPKIAACGPLAAWLYVCGIAYANRQLTNGLIPDGQVRKLADVDDAPALARKLVEVGLWERCEGGYNIHDYAEYQPSAEQVKAERAATAERVRAWRFRQKGERNAVTNTVTNGATNGDVTTAPVPDPVPVPVPVPNPDPTPARGMQGGVPPSPLPPSSGFAGTSDARVSGFSIPVAIGGERADDGFAEGGNARSRVLAALATHPGNTVSGLADRLRMPYPTVNGALRKLMSASPPLVSREEAEAPNPHRYFLTASKQAVR